MKTLGLIAVTLVSLGAFAGEFSMSELAGKYSLRHESLKDLTLHLSPNGDALLEAANEVTCEGKAGVEGTVVYSDLDCINGVRIFLKFYTERVESVEGNFTADMVMDGYDLYDVSFARK